jgi:hypothetical protein
MPENLGPGSSGSLLEVGGQEIGQRGSGMVVVKAGPAIRHHEEEVPGRLQELQTLKQEIDRIGKMFEIMWRMI